MIQKRYKEYELFDGDYTAFVDYSENKVVIYERGGWGRRYEMGFKALATQAKKRRVIFDPSAPEAEIVDMGARLIIDIKSLFHGLRDDQYVKSPTTLSKQDLEVIRNFEELLVSHGADLVSSGLNKKHRMKLLRSIAKLV
jgi:hypothetical protein